MCASAPIPVRGVSSLYPRAPPSNAGSAAGRAREHESPGRRQRRDVTLEQGNDDMEFFWFILIGVTAGWMAGQYMRGGGFGVVGDIVTGVSGALVGGFLFHQLGLAAGGGLIGALIVATIGAGVLLFLVRMIKPA
jgi:uncharacterized membrane protein YeaQ/YmgE (transglycosylase-associated protein family)